MNNRNKSPIVCDKYLRLHRWHGNLLQSTLQDLCCISDSLHQQGGSTTLDIWMCWHVDWKGKHLHWNLFLEGQMENDHRSGSCACQQVVTNLAHSCCFNLVLITALQDYWVLVLFLENGFQNLSTTYGMNVWSWSKLHSTCKTLSTKNHLPNIGSRHHSGGEVCSSNPCYHLQATLLLIELPRLSDHDFCL